MATVIINHTVKDYNIWKEAFDSDEERRKGMGANLLAVGHKSGDSANVWAIFSVEDLSGISAALSDPQFQERLASFGVLTTDVVVLN